MLFKEYPCTYRMGSLEHAGSSVTPHFVTETFCIILHLNRQIYVLGICEKHCHREHIHQFGTSMTFHWREVMLCADGPFTVKVFTQRRRLELRPHVSWWESHDCKLWKQYVNLDLIASLTFSMSSNRKRKIPGSLRRFFTLCLWNMQSTAQLMFLAQTF